MLVYGVIRSIDVRSRIRVHHGRRALSFDRRLVIEVCHSVNLDDQINLNRKVERQSAHTYG